MTAVQIFLVGGAVRDIVIGNTPNDFDFVVVGSTPEEMKSLGFRQVGADFPVFLHPHTDQEFALARTERKTGIGHRGFTCEWRGVTIEEDLSRRDFTMNAMAIELIGRSNWDGNELLNFVAGITEPWDESDFVSVRPKIIDPFGGIDDIRDKVIRHVSSAFKEDPLRVLRAFRFLARFGDGWCVSSATKLFCQEIARDGGLDHLTPERVWGEIEKALSGNRPSLFFSGLAEVCDIFPEWNAMIGVHQRTQHHPEKWVDVHTGMVMDWAALNTGDPMVVFAGLCHDFGKPLVTTEDGKAHNHEAAGVPVVKAFCDKWKVPNDFRDIAIMTCRDHLKVHSCLGRGDQKGLKASTIMKMFEENRALQKPELFNQFLTACEADAKGRGGDFPTRDYRQAEFLFKCLEAVIKLDTKPIAEDAIARGKKFEQIGEAVRRARINVIQEVKDLWN